MKKRLIFILIIGFLITRVLIKWIELPFEKEDICGKYININYERKHCCVEAPHKADTLILKENGEFYSSFYGRGVYIIKMNYPFSTIELRAKDINFHTSFENKLFENIRIVLNPDNNHSYEKID